MNPARAAALRRRLLAWYDAGHRALPWRFPQRAADPYRVWLAEVMLQQTQVQAVIPYYERFLARFPTLEALAAAREEDVLALWGGLGYYARGRNLLAAARAAVERHGELPASLEALRALPGFGPYTAGAVASIAFAIPAPVVDGNVARVLARLCLVEGAPADAAVRARLWALAAALVDPARPGDLNQALMELGATVCGKPVPRCEACPVARLCLARAAGRERAVPPARARPERRPLTLACALVEERGAVLVVRRPRGGLFAGLLGPPAVAVEVAEDAPAALARSVAAEHGIRLGVGEEVARVERTLTHRALTLRGFRCDAHLPSDAAGSRWLAPDGPDAVALPAAFRALLETFFSTSRGVRGKKRASRLGPGSPKSPRSRSGLTRGGSSV